MQLKKEYKKKDAEKEVKRLRGMKIQKEKKKSMRQEEEEEE